MARTAPEPAARRRGPAPARALAAALARADARGCAESTGVAHPTDTPLALKRCTAGALRALGVTRVARVSGLDRTGVEVACAVRPGGHVLQVTNGKGESWAEAERGALLEAAELACAERVAAADLALASAPELAALGVPFVAPAELGGDACDGARLAWRRALSLATGEEVLVPAAAVHAPAQGGPLLGAVRLRWTTNGMGAHASWRAALLHALLEAVERDQLARALPDGFTEREVRSRRIARGAVVSAAPAVARLCSRVEQGGFEVHFFDAAPQDGAIGLPVAAALLFDRERGPVPLTAGYACALDLAAALRGALLEAAQSRLTDIHGAREDVAPMDEREVERLRRVCERAGKGEGDLTSGAPAGQPPHPRNLATERDASRSVVQLDRDRERPLSPTLSPALRGRGRQRDLDRDLGRKGAAMGDEGHLPPPPRGRAGERVADLDLDRALRRVLRLLHRAGHARVLALDLAPADFPVHVAKVIVPGLLLSDLL